MRPQNVEKVDNKWLNYEIIKFESGNISFDVMVSPNEDTIWLSAANIATLFERDISVIRKHVSAILKDNEQIENSVKAKFASTGPYGKTYQIDYYNLDMIISIGFRVKSKRGVEFRRWANNILKQYLIKGYSINTKRCLEHSDIILKLQNEASCLINKLDEYDDKFNQYNSRIR